MKKLMNKNIKYSLFFIASANLNATSLYELHSSIYNTPSSSNAIYNSYNIFREDSQVDNFNGNQDDFDTEDIVYVNNNRNDNFLEKAILEHKYKDIQDFLSRNTRQIKNLVDFQNKDGRTPLHFAAQENDINTTRLLLSVGANLNIADFQGWTPLHIAVQNNDFEIVQLLIAAGANRFLKNLNDQVAIDFAKNDRMRLLLQ